MYICVNYSGKGNKNAYVKLMEAYCDDNGKKRARVIKNFGRLDDLLAKDPMALENLKQTYKDKMIQEKQSLAAQRIKEVMESLQNSEETKSRFKNTLFPQLNYGYYALKNIWDEDLGLTWKLNYLQKASKSRVQFSFCASTLFMTCLKVIDPGSVLYSYGSKDNFLGDPMKEVSLENCYDTLSFLKENKDKIFHWCNKKLDQKFGKERATLIFYDVTNAYFETALTDAERDYEQSDFAERVQEAADSMRIEGLLSKDCFDNDGLVIPDKLPLDFWETDANNRLRYLRMRGPSKEHRLDLPIVSIALIIDKNGFPMDFEVFSGNASEFKTMKPAIKKLKNKYNIKDAIVVADRGLNSASNLKMLKDLDLGFLVAQKVTNFNEELTKKMLDLSQYTPFDPDSPDKGMYQIVNDWKKRNSKGEYVDCMLVLTFNEKRKQRDEKIIDVMVDIINKKKAAGEKLGPKKTGWAAFAQTDGTKEECRIIGVDENAVAKKRRFSGFAAVVYDDSPSFSQKLNSEKEEQNDSHQKKRFFDGKNIVGHYSQLNKIEESFRLLKTNFGLRPMYVRTSDHIRGHITICMLSLLLMRLLQHRLNLQGKKLSTNEICRSLYNATVCALGIDDDFLFLLSGMQEDVRKNHICMPTKELVNLIKEGDITTTSYMPDIMKACGLTPLNRVHLLSDLAKSLHTRFATPAEAVPEVRLATL